jgi:biopolymer transport protein ExbD
MEITLKLNVNAVNVVLSALARAPYGDVADVINAIRDQAAPQVEAASKAAPEPVKED